MIVFIVFVASKDFSTILLLLFRRVCVTNLIIVKSFCYLYFLLYSSSFCDQKYIFLFHLQLYCVFICFSLFYFLLRLCVCVCIFSYFYLFYLFNLFFVVASLLSRIVDPKIILNEWTQAFFIKKIRKEMKTRGNRNKIEKFITTNANCFFKDFFLLHLVKEKSVCFCNLTTEYRLKHWNIYTRAFRVFVIHILYFFTILF